MAKRKRKPPGKATFESEAVLCEQFLAHLPAGWTAYPEWADYDLLLVGPDGQQIGVEAKLTLNAKVLSQLIDQPDWSAIRPGPDFRAALVPFGKASTLFGIAEALGLAVIQMHDAESFQLQRVYGRAERQWFTPALPNALAAPKTLSKTPRSAKRAERLWPEWCPATRLELPSVVPTGAAGVPAPKRMTAWKVKAIRLAVLLDCYGWVSRQDFAQLELSMSYWTRERLIINQARNRWVAGDALPDFAAQYPAEWAFYRENIEKWSPRTSRDGEEFS